MVFDLWIILIPKMTYTNKFQMEIYVILLHFICIFHA